MKKMLAVISALGLAACGGSHKVANSERSVSADALATVAFVNATPPITTNTGLNTSLAALNVTAGNAVIVGVTTAGSITSITDTAGNTYTQQGSSGLRSIWAAFNATGNASNVITVHLAGTAALSFGAAQYSGLSGQKGVSATGTATSPATSVTTGSFTPVAGDLGILYVFDNSFTQANGTAWGSNSGFTVRVGNNNTVGGYYGSALLDKVNLTGTSQTANATNSQSNGALDALFVAFHAQDLTPACTGFTYSDWSPAVCPQSGQQTRTVATATPAGCVGGSPGPLAQSCTYVPPTCTYTYSEWGACGPDGTQTRTLLSSLPDGCVGTPDPVSQACTYVPPPVIVVPGGTQQFSVYNPAGPVTWTTSAGSVDTTGLFTAPACGGTTYAGPSTVNVTATVNGASSVIPVTVAEKVLSISVNPIAPDPLVPGATQQFTAAVTHSCGTTPAQPPQ